MRRIVLLLSLLISSVVKGYTPNIAAETAYKDAVNIPKQDRIFYRYLWWPRGWGNAGLLTKAQQSLLSVRKPLPNPVYIAHGVYRIDFRESGWEKRFQVWEKFAAIDFVFHAKGEFFKDDTYEIYYPPGIYNGKYYGPSYSNLKVKKGDVLDVAAPWANDEGYYDKLRQMLYTEVPILMGPFWLVRVMRQLDLDEQDNGVGYYNWFGIKNRNDFFKVIGLNEKVAEELEQEWRAWIKQSGVAVHERIAGAYNATTGKVWFTLDMKKQKGRGQPGRNLLPDELDVDAEEWFGHLPNKLPINAAVASKANKALGIKAGDLQAFVPNDIAGDRSARNLEHTNDLRINPSTCWNCHGERKDYIVPFVDNVSEQHTRKTLIVDPYKKELDLLSSLYLQDLQREARLDRDEYAFAIARLTHDSRRREQPYLTVAGFTSIYMDAYYRYTWPKNDDGSKGVNLETACNEMGLEKWQFLKGLIAYNKSRKASDWILSEFMHDPPRTITRLAWEESYPLAQVVGRGIHPPEIKYKIKGVKK